MAETRKSQPDTAEITTATITEQAQGSARYSFDVSDLFEIEELKNRRLYINGEIDDTILDGIAFHIMRYNRDDKGLPIEDRRPIVLFMNTTGGSTTAGFGLIDVIETSETPIHTVNMAECASMGFLIYIAGDMRFSMPHAQFLMHDGACAAWDSTAKVKDRVEFEMEQIEAMTKAHVLNNTKITPKLYDEKYRVEWYFLPEMGKDIGVVDSIIGKDCSMSDIGTYYQKSHSSFADANPPYIRINIDKLHGDLSTVLKEVATNFSKMHYALLEEEKNIDEPFIQARVNIVDLDKIRTGNDFVGSVIESFGLPGDTDKFKTVMRKLLN